MFICFVLASSVAQTKMSCFTQHSGAGSDGETAVFSLVTVDSKLTLGALQL